MGIAVKSPRNFQPGRGIRTRMGCMAHPYLRTEAGASDVVERRYARALPGRAPRPRYGLRTEWPGVDFAGSGSECRDRRRSSTIEEPAPRDGPTDGFGGSERAIAAARSWIRRQFRARFTRV